MVLTPILCMLSRLHIEWNVCCQCEFKMFHVWSYYRMLLCDDRNISLLIALWASVRKNWTKLD